VDVRVASVTPFDLGNTLLAGIEPGDKPLLKGKLRELSIKPGTALSALHAGRPIVFFPCDRAVLSLRTVLKKGEMVECGVVNSDGMWPIGNEDSPNTIAISYRAARIIWMDSEEFEKARQESPSLKDLVAEYSVTLARNAMQLAACNAAHAVDQRLARWLLQMTEQAETNVLLATHDDLGSALGVGRSYITRILSKLQRVGAIRCQRGMIYVKDRSALRNVSCGCEIHMLRPEKNYRDEPSHSHRELPAPSGA